MTCARCGTKETKCLAALTPNVHYRLCLACGDDWERHAKATLVMRNTNGAVLAAFRRWCESGRRQAA